MTEAFEIEGLPVTALFKNQNLVEKINGEIDFDSQEFRKKLIYFFNPFKIILSPAVINLINVLRFKNENLGKCPSMMAPCFFSPNECDGFKVIADHSSH